MKDDISSQGPQGAVNAVNSSILCLPSAGNNPYQSLLYSQLDPATTLTYGGPGAIDRLETENYSIVHIHWDDRMFGRGEDHAENQALLAQKVHKLRGFKSAGGRIVWTIHNRAPHKSGDMATFEEGRRQLSELADAIHVHADHAADHMVSTYGTDRTKIVTIPHPSYLGVYEPADTTLKRQPKVSVPTQFLFFGMFRGDKGIHEIRDAAGKMTKRGYTFNLRMYGKAFGSQARLLRLLEANPNVDLRPDRISDEEVAGIFSSSHFFLAPYRSLFTSGSVMLALTFGLPIIGPNVRELRETTPETCHSLLYDPEAPRGLIRALIESSKMPRKDVDDLRKSCIEFAQERAPDKIGRTMAELLAQP